MRALSILFCLLLVSSGCLTVKHVPTGTQTTEATPLYQQDARTPTQPTTPSAREWTNATQIEQEIHRQVNEIRTKRGLDPLVYDDRLSAIGRYHSWDMAQRGYFSHAEKGRGSYTEMRRRYEYVCNSDGQNIHLIEYNMSFQTSHIELTQEKILGHTIVFSWMNSTGHRRNILDPDFEAEGIGVFVTANGSVYVTQEFCG